MSIDIRYHMHVHMLIIQLGMFTAMYVRILKHIIHTYVHIFTISIHAQMYVRTYACMYMIMHNTYIHIIFTYVHCTYHAWRRQSRNGQAIP